MMALTPNGLWVPDEDDVPKPEPEIDWPPVVSWSLYGPLPPSEPVSAFFRCECGKLHMKQSGERCPCGIEFPYEHRPHHYRSAA